MGPPPCSDSTPRTFSLATVSGTERQWVYPSVFPALDGARKAGVNVSDEQTRVCWLICKMSEHSDKPLILVPGPMPGKSDMGGGPERRRAVRYPFTASAEIMDLRSNTRVTGRSSDLGLGGCYIDILSPFAVGSAVGVRLEREQHVFEAMATVTYAQMSFGMGLSFTEVKPEHQAVLQTWVDRLSGKRLPESHAAAGRESEMLPTLLNLQQVLNELVNMMVRKKVINESEGSALIRQIFR